MSRVTWTARPHGLLVPLALVGLLAVPSTAAAQAGTTGARAEESRTLALAIQLERSGQPVEAERVLIEFLGTQPTAAQALSMLARLSESRGAPDVVLPYAEAAAEQAGYDEAIIHQTLIRALAASGLSDEALERARAWVDARPSDVTGYGELSSTFATLGQRDEAIQTLIDARGRTDDDDLFAQELATLYEQDGRYDDAAQEWLRVLAWGDAGVTGVAAHLRAPGTDDEAVVAALETALDGSSVGVGALRGGLDLATRLDRPAWARELAERTVERAPRETRWQLLRMYYQDARDGGYAEDARWAAGRLAADAGEERDRLQWEAIEASLALELGDEEHARTAFRRILDTAPAGSDTRRLALASLVVLSVDEDDRAAEGLIQAHAREYPREQAELADLSIRLSRARARTGDIAGARRALDLAPSQPSDASVAARLEAQRGQLALFEGNVAAATQHLQVAGAIPGGDPGQRTEILLFLDVFSRADSAQVAELGRGIHALQARDDADPLLESAGRWAAGGDPGASAGLLRLSAGALERADRPAEAREVREQLVEAYPGTAEATGALLALARSALPQRPDIARSWLEKLIIEHPGSALAPVARRLLSEIDGMVPPGSNTALPEVES